MARVIILSGQQAQHTVIEFRSRYDEEKQRHTDPAVNARVFAEGLRSRGYLVAGPAAPEWRYQCP